MAIDLGRTALIHFLGKRVFRDYEPCQFESFDHRFEKWLENVETDEDRHLLEEMLLNIFYVGRKEFESLYRSLYGGVLANWIIEQDGLDLFDEKLATKIHTEANAAWICPITDSLRINAFLKVNAIVGKPLRPDWKSLEEFADLEKIRDFVRQNKIRKLILLEDFVGSGTQSGGAVKFAAEALRALAWGARLAQAGQRRGLLHQLVFLLFVNFRRVEGRAGFAYPSAQACLALGL